MSAFPTNLLDHLFTHHGVVGTAGLKRLKVSRSTRERLVRDGLLDVVYRLRGWPQSFESRCAALCAADPTIVICCQSACRLQGLRHCTSDTIHFMTTRTTVPVKTEGANVVAHRTTLLPRSHIVRRADGIRLTRASRSIVDESRHRKALPLESLIEDAFDKGKCTVQTLRSTAAEMAGRGRRGLALLDEVLSGRPAWRRPVGSHPELVLRDALCRAGLELTTQPALTLPDGRTIHPDLGEIETSFFIEVDDHEWHGGRARTTRDNQRDRRAGGSGASIVRVGTDEIEHALADVVEEVLALYRERRRLLGLADVA